MIRGTEQSLRPFIKRILIEDAFQTLPNKSSQHNQYYSFKVKNEDYAINLAIDFCIKKHLNRINNTTLGSIASLLSSYTLQVEFIDSREELSKFLTLSGKNKANYLNKFKHKDFGFLGGVKLNFSLENFKNYLSISSGDNKKRELNIPFSIIKKYTKGIDKSNKNPNFLACVCFFTLGGEMIVDASITTEIVFSDSAIPDSSGYFIISDKFSFRGVEQSLTKIDTLIKKRHLNPITGESLNPNINTDRNLQVNYLFGAPGDIWAGAVHVHPITDPSNVNFGKGRIMAGAQHSSEIPHPYLKFVSAENKKIIDFRNASSFEDKFSYKSGINVDLSSQNRVIYTQQKNINLPLDDYITNKPVFSACKFSIRPISRRRGSQGVTTKDNVVLFFGLDKRNLLKETTKVPTLLDRLLEVDSSFYIRLVNDINIVHFEIIRVNKNSGHSNTLLIGNNDKSFNDLNVVNQLGRNISKGFSLVNKTNDIYLENGNAKGQINLYEFTDGEIDAHRDSEKYYYKIKLKFRDPMISFLTDKLNNLNKAIYDLDDLLQKVSLTMIDPSTGRRVKVFDEFKSELNASFVNQSLNPTVNSSLPLDFSFDKQSELPESIAKIISNNSDIASYFSAINLIFNNNFQTININHFFTFVRNSLMLSNTTPTLIEKNRSLMALLRDRTEKLLKLFSVEKMTKKSSGFTSKDYLKSSRSSKAISDGAITEYEYSFKQSIDLSKTGDHFNWIEEARSEINTGFKTISGNTYKGLVENKNITNYLTELGKNDPQVSNLFDYSFLPYSSPAVLDLHKTDKVNLSLNHLQTLRNKLIQNTSDNPESVLIPELLSTFGIKFLHPKRNLESYVTDQTNYIEGDLPINSGFEDNFGSEFSSLNKGSENFETLSFGSVLSENTAWAGMNYNNYPSNTALSILNLTTTKAFHRKDIDYLFNTHKEMTNKVRLPYTTKLFSSEIMSSRETADTVMMDIVDNLFDSNGLMKFEKYSYYSYLLNIFAKVYYLKGFAGKQGQSFGADDNRFLPSSRVNFSFIKDMEWEPLTSGVINAIPTGRTIICKVMLYQGDDTRNLIDSNITNMYKKYYNYNKLFLIKQGGGLSQNIITAAPLNDPSAPPTQVADFSYGAETRDLLDKQVKMMKVLSTEEERSSAKRDPKEEIVIKKSNSPLATTSTTYTKRIRR
jgi:hypothetical protein